MRRVVVISLVAASAIGMTPLAALAPTALVQGFSWFSDGSFAKTAVSGTVITVYATSARTNTAYQLISGISTTSQPCGVDTVPVNASVRLSNSRGFIPNTAGVLNRPVGRWDVCFSEVTPGREGFSVTLPLSFRVAPGPSVAAVSGHQLLLRKRNPDGTLSPSQPFAMRGVGYSPASRDTNTSPSDPNNANVRRLEFGRWYPYDVPRLATMNVNTVRLFIDPGFDATLGPAGIEFLDALHRYGIFAVMTVDDGVNNLDRVRDAVTFYRDHPAVLMWSLGSEWNINRYFGVASSVADAAQRTQQAAALIKSLDANHPVATSYGEIDIDAPGLRLADTAQYVAQLTSVDVWALNIYRGSRFGNLFQQWASITTKPMFLGEFGTDAFNATTGEVDEAMQSQWDLGLWNEVAANLSSANSAKVALGATVAFWTDEWWKVPPPGSQQTGGYSGPHPDGFANEEYFGVVWIDRQPRQAYTALKAAFAS